MLIERTGNSVFRLGDNVKVKAKTNLDDRKIDLTLLEATSPGGQNEICQLKVQQQGKRKDSLVEKAASGKAVIAAAIRDVASHESKSDRIWLARGAGHIKNHPDRLVELYVSKERQDDSVRDIVNQCHATGVRPQWVPKQALEKRAEGGNHQGVVATVQSPPTLTEHDLPKLLEQSQQAGLFLILDGVTDPHNLGACLRTADAAGVTGVIVPKDKSAQITPTVRKVASGAAENVPLVVVTN